MKADEARKITDSVTDKVIDVTVVKSLTDRCYRLIEQAAKKGESSIRDPFRGLRQRVTNQQKEYVYKTLGYDGYEVKTEGAPGECELSTTISW